jgi:hypothetical protein
MVHPLHPKSDEDTVSVKAVVNAVRRGDAEVGWSALFAEKTTVSGLGYSFGTKVLYFAGYRYTP